MWAPLMPVRDQGINDDNFPYLTVDGSGVVWIVWSSIDQSFGDLEAYYSRWNGAGWDPAQTVNPPNDIDDLVPRIACANDGTPWVVWKIPDVARAPTYAGVASHWTGSGWSPPDTVWTEGGRSDTYELAATSGDDLWVVRDGATGSGGDSDIRVYHLKNGQLDPAVTFVDPDSIDLNPRVAVDAGGDPWVTWVKNPPLSPQLSRIAFTHRSLGSWTSPRSLPFPYGINRGNLMVDSNGLPWIICNGSDPELGPFSYAIWALNWNGSDWSAPTRISEPTASSDSIQYQLSVSRGYRQPPRAVWGRGNVFDYTRSDVVTTGWDGTNWSPVEIVGDLADSADISWPTVTTQSGRVWIAYMIPTSPSGRSRIVTTYSPYAPTLAVSADLTLVPQRDGVSIRWQVLGLRDVSGVEIYRALGAVTALQPSIGAPGVARVLALDGAKTSGDWLDREAQCGETQTYWIRAVRSDASDVWAGPETVHSSGGQARLISATPNPARALVLFRGVLGPGEPAFIDIFSVQGNLVASLPISAGITNGTSSRRFELSWDGRNRSGTRVSSGVYYARLRGRAGAGATTKRLVLLGS